ncbi:hypothetical protein KY343_00725 [Candidatus Woesearchaeota archaeon]|nr:hypothetical protein [Candidatus Woesearchaeota archaeon]
MGRLKLFNTKKALLFNISLVLITIIVLTTALIALGQVIPFKEGIGSRAFDIVEVYQEGENKLFYVDQAAKLSAQQAAYDLAQKGGFSNKTKCGKKEDYSIWLDATKKDCYPDYKNEFNKDFNKIMKGYLSSVPLYVNYETSLFDERIIGIPHRATVLFFYSGKSMSNYTIYPSFNVNINYDINKYRDLKEQSNNLISECTNKTVSCVNSKAAEFNWNITSAEQNFFKFYYKDNNTKVLVNNIKNELSHELIAYKFALYVPLQ